MHEQQAQVAGIRSRISRVWPNSLTFIASTTEHPKLIPAFVQQQPARGLLSRRTPTIINPSRLKELVLVAEERGAIFPSVLHTIIDRAISRDATALFRHSPDDLRLDGPPVPS